ncbi:imidazole glycerol phosphate synthase, glutamine amidotransferase subunit [candidate division KSB1 bacterium RBG_16_48_16]|nr:MAG: imidazole glycerol phosphate synthase, glutamine amidotransferase subunit [candidate division KSB1 bacterium RBG_16_48_16]
MICIVDYDAGNLRSVQKAVEYLGFTALLTSRASDLEKADKIIFPGVGAFGKTAEAMDKLGLRPVLIDQVQKNKPFFGICLGLQLLFAESEENPGVAGLGILSGRVQRFPRTLKVPHLGWNVLTQNRDSILFKDIPQDSYFYFAHSYYVLPDDPSVIIGQSEYDFMFPVAIQRENLYGVQFHPEKSQQHGLQVLRNFLQL